MTEASVESPLEEIKVIYYVDEQDTPYLTKIHQKQNKKITLNDLKNVLGSKRFQHNHRFFFKSIDDDIGEVKEEISENFAVLPYQNGKIVTWIIPTGEDDIKHCAESSSSSSGPASIQSAPAFAKDSNRTRAINRSASAMTSRLKVSNHQGSETTLNSDNSIVHLVDSLDESTDDSTISPVRENDREQFRSNKLRTCQGKHYESCTESSFMYSDDDVTLGSESNRYAFVHEKQIRRRRRHLGSQNKFSGMSSCSSSLSLNLITVTLNLDNVKFLGVSIVGQNPNGIESGRKDHGNGGIYVGSVMKGGAVALDGRIEAGDMILQVNDVSFESLTDEQAICELRKAVGRPGSIRLVVAKGWNPNPSGYFSLNRRQSVQPVDPSEWVAQTAAAMKSQNSIGPSFMDCDQRSFSSTASSITKMYESNHFQNEASTSNLNLTINCDMESIARVMASPNSGLDVRDRMWLKVRIPDAFLGGDLVHWLYTNVDGFADKRDARRYASNMLKAGYIQATVNKVNFSEQCYYVFGDICKDFSYLAIDDVADSTLKADENSLLNFPNANQIARRQPMNIPEMYRRPLPQIESSNVSETSSIGRPSINCDTNPVEHDAYHFPTTPTIMSSCFDSERQFSIFVDKYPGDQESPDQLSDSEFDQLCHSTALNSPVSSQHKGVRSMGKLRR